jgi:geranylgeranyl pyrophosphate synthase
MATLDLAEYLRTHRLSVDDHLERRLPAADVPPAPVNEAVRYITFSGGKRLRPICTLAVAEIFEHPDAAIFDAASAVELAHTASLILDDLPCMDDATERRGKAPLHLTFSTETAILASMAALSHAFRLADSARAARRPEGRTAALLAEAIGTSGLVLGQHLDLHMTGRETSLEEIQQIHHHKAGALFVAAIAIPLDLLGRPAEECDALLQYAEKLGLAFQITDDIQDEMTEAEHAGKTTFTDHLGREGAQARVDQLTEEALAALEPFGHRAEPLLLLAQHVRASSRG